SRFTRSAPRASRPIRSSSRSAHSIRRSPGLPRPRSPKYRATTQKLSRGGPMIGKSLCACALALALTLAMLEAAQAHGLIGKRFFPATLATDDPFVSDELSLPTISYLKLRGTEDAPPTNQITFSGEFSKRLTPDLGISLGGSLIVLDPVGGSSVNGFDNLEV